MNLSSDLYIHVGFPKTATTTLQCDVFAKHSGVQNLGKPCFANNEDWHDAIRHLQSADSQSYRQSWCTDILRSTLESRYRSDAIRLLSNEGLTNIYCNQPNTIADRLFSVFGPIKIVFTIREQLKFLQSFYLYYVDRGHLRKSFMRWRNADRQRGERAVQSLADFNKVIKYYVRTFGRNNVEVLPFEELVNDSSKFAERLSRTLSIEPTETRDLIEAAEKRNERLSERAYRFSITCGRLVPRAAARLFSRTMSGRLQSRFKTWLDQGRHAQVKIPPYLTNEFQQLYRHGNRELSEEFGLDLHRYGYCC